MYLTFLPLSIQTNHKLLLNDTKSFFFLQSSNISIKIHHTHTHTYIYMLLSLSLIQQSESNDQTHFFDRGNGDLLPVQVAQFA